jgi:uncharacterized protein (DUF2336 family)
MDLQPAPAADVPGFGLTTSLRDEAVLLATNFISDLEKAIAERSAETGAMLRQITDLFLINAGHHSAEQLGVYDEVLQLLIAKVDAAARATLARRIADIQQGLRETVRALALDVSVEVAEPILVTSNQLDDDFLLDCIAIRGQGHMLAIATRNSVTERVSDQLIKRGDQEVLGAVVNNPGAEISEPSFSILMERSAGNEWLSECIGRRVDIPDHHLRELVARASETVRQRLIGNDPKRQQLLDGILPAGPIAAAGETKDYRTAELMVRSRPLTEAAVIDFAEKRMLDEVVVAVARLANLSFPEAERLLMGTWLSPVAVIFKAIGFQLSSLTMIYQARLPSGASGRADLVRTKAEFIALRRQTAERILRFYQLRKSTDAVVER